MASGDAPRGGQYELGGIREHPEEPVEVVPDTVPEQFEEPINEPLGSGIFAFVDTAQDVPLVTGMAYPDSFVLDLSGEQWSAERYTDGLDLIFHRDCFVRLVFS